MGYGEDSIIHGGRHIKNIWLRIVDKPGWSIHEGNRIALMHIAAGNRGLALHRQRSAADHHIEACDGSAQTIGYKSIDPSAAEIINGHIPRSIYEVLICNSLHLLA